MNATGALDIEVFEWVLRASWQAAVLAGLILLAQLLLRKHLSPGWRYGLWLLLVVRLLIPVMPRSATSLFNLTGLNPPWMGLAMALPASLPAASLPTSADAHEKRRSAGVNAADPHDSWETAARGDRRPGVENPGNGPISGPVVDWMRVAFRFWIAGSCFCVLRLVWSNARFRSRLAGYVPVANAKGRPHFEECLKAMGIHERVTLIETEEVNSPAVYGLWHKRLLLPPGTFERFSGGELRCIFLHELAHLKRGDLEIHWLVSALQTVHWFNPVLWLAFARMRADREMACDARALCHLDHGEGIRYGETILKLLEGLVRPPAIPGLVGISEDKTWMKQRMRMIAAFKRPSRRPALAALLVAGLSAIGLTDGRQAFSAGSRNSDIKPVADTETDDRFWVDAKINGKPARLFLDTGLENFCLYRPAAERLGLKLKRVESLFLYSRGQKPYWATEECVVSLWGESRRAAFAIYDVPSYLPPREGDGMVGWCNVNEKVIVFDASERNVRFIDAVANEVNGWTKLNVRTNLPWGSRGLALDLPCADGSTAVIFIGTGLKAGGVWLSPQRWRQWKDAHPNQPTRLLAGHNQLAGSMVRERAWAKELALGPLKLTDVVIEEAVPVPASLGLAATDEVASFGMAALKRLDLIVDGKHGVAYLRPKTTSTLQPPNQSIGPSAAFVPRNARSEDLVAHVANASPAYEAGIRDGDVLLQVGQRDATKWRTDPEFPRFIFPTVPRGELTGTQLELTLKRGEQTFKATAAEQEIGIFAPTPETNSSK